MDNIREYIVDQVMQNHLDKKQGARFLQELDERPASKAKDIAVIGMAGRFPKADSLAAFWDLLVNGEDCIGPYPMDRRQYVNPYVAGELGVAADQIEYYDGGYLSHIFDFDAEAFHIAPGEAKLIDPQQRILLQETEKALQDAGYTKEQVNGSCTGVYIGCSQSDYGRLIPVTEPSAVAGNLASVLASRISYFYNFTGPSLVIDTSCSSSLVALAQACRDLYEGRIHMAVVGGVNLNLFPVKLDTYGLRTEAPDYRCKAFDESADGIGSGEGCGVVILKSMTSAKAQNDHIYAVVKGAAVNSDGKTSGITAPNPLAQQNLIMSAWKDAGIRPDDVTYIEAHGTGTPIGDPIEIQGIDGAFKQCASPNHRCAVGSVKTNIGHLDSAAGIASFIKTALMLHNGFLPKSLHFRRFSPLVDASTLSIRVQTKGEPWRTQSGRLIAGVSAFGLSGTNCHVVLENIADNGAPTPLAVPLSRSDSRRPREIVYNYIPRSATEKKEAPVEGYSAFADTLRFGESIMQTSGAAGNVEKQDMLDRYAVSLIVEYLQSQGLELDHPRTMEDIRKKAAVTEQYRRLFDYMLGVLIQRHIAVSDQETVCLSAEYRHVPAQELLESAVRQLPDNHGEFLLLRHCMEAYPEILSGKTNALRVLYPKGNNDLIHQYVRDHHPLADSVQLVGKRAVAQYIDRMKNQPLKILEIGAGAGIFTQQVLPLLAGLDLEYHFTDISNGYLVDARERFREYPFVQYHLLDINEEPAAPLAGSMDLVIGLNVVHTVADVTAALRNIGDYLRKDGMLFLVEDVNDAVWTTLVWGLTDGWWTFHDLSLRQCSPLMSIEKWKRALSEAGFTDAVSLPSDQRLFPEVDNALIAAQKSAAYDPRRDLHDAVWLETPLKKSAADALEGRWLIFHTNGDIGRCVDDLLMHRGVDTIAVEPAAAYEEVAPKRKYRVRPNNALDIGRLLVDLCLDKEPVTGILYMWGLENGRDDAQVWTDSLLGFYHLVREISRLQNRLIPVTLVTDRAMHVLDSDTDIQPEKAALWGFSRVVSQEYPLLQCGCMDIETHKDSLYAARAIVEEAAVPISERVYSVAYRGQKRLVQHIVPPSAQESPDGYWVRDEDVILLAGGMGYVGLHLCLTIASAVRHPTFILVGRTTLPGREEWPSLLETLPQDAKLRYQIEAIQAIEQRGAVVVAMAGDVTDKEALSDICALVRREYGRIDGVFNCVMQVYRKRVSELTANELYTAVSAKIQSVINLDEVTGEDALRYFVMLSSVSSVFGGAGRSDCAAANMVQDVYTYVRRRRRANQYTLALSLPGLAQDKPDSEEPFPIMSAAELDAAFRRIMVLRSPFILFEHLEEQRLTRLQSLLRVPIDFTASSLSAQPVPPAHNEVGGAAESAQAPAGAGYSDNIPEEIRRIWLAVLGYGDVDENEDFFNVGGDSLMAIKLLDGIKETFGLDLDVSVIFTYPSLRSFTDYVMQQLAPNSASASRGDDLSDLLDLVQTGTVSVDLAIQRLSDQKDE
jgi:acyl transferase domain-containing protein/acyl carrier protein/ubiquinone/menaquinone biosynthesis C-methylase UbiE